MQRATLPWLLARVRWVWQQLRETANPHTTHTAELTSEERARQSSYESFDYYTAYPDIYLRYVRQRHTRTTSARATSAAQQQQPLHNCSTHSCLVAGSSEDNNNNNGSSSRNSCHARDDGVREQLLAHTNNTNNTTTMRRCDDDRDGVGVAEARSDAQHTLLRWSLYVLIAVVVALVAAAVTVLVSALEHHRAHTLYRVITGCRVRLLGYAAGYVVYVTSSVVLIAVAAGVVVVCEPAAAGGGIPDVMAYLNGVYVRRAMHLRTFAVKCVSCVCAVAGGLPVGLEAPLIHLGAIAAAGVTQGRSRTLRLHTRLFAAFRNNKDRRDFITAGAACGVSAAFGAPIGGLLFVLEELASFTDAATSGQLFLACMCCFTTVRLLAYVAQERHWLSWADGGGDTVALLFEVNRTIALHMVSIVPALLLGAVLGGVAALFTKANLLLLRWRRAVVRPHTLRRLLEPLLLVALYHTLLYALTLMTACAPLYEAAEAHGGTVYVWGSEAAARVHNATCTTPRTYSPFGTLAMASGKNAVRHLLSRQTAGAYPLYALVLYTLLYTCFACAASGTAVSGGLVVPSLVVGAAVGRVYGVMLWYTVTHLLPGHAVGPLPYDHSSSSSSSITSSSSSSSSNSAAAVVARGYRAVDAWSDPGVFALIGAAAFLAGTSRMTISVCVIMMELSSELHYLLPVMVATVMAKSVADWLCEPLYHHLLRLDCVPYLAAQLPWRSFQQLTAADVMSREVVTLRARERTTRVLRALRDTTHHAFPVMEEDEEAAYNKDDDDDVDDATSASDSDIVHDDSDDDDDDEKKATRRTCVHDEHTSPRARVSTRPPTPATTTLLQQQQQQQPTPPSPPWSTSSWLLLPPSAGDGGSRCAPPSRPRCRHHPRRRRRVVYKFAGLVTREDLLVYFALLQSLTTTTASQRDNNNNDGDDDDEQQRLDARVRAINDMTWCEWSAHKAALFLAAATTTATATLGSSTNSSNISNDRAERVAACWLPQLDDMLDKSTSSSNNNNNHNHSALAATTALDHHAADVALSCSLPVYIDLSHIVNRSPWVVPPYFNCQMTYHVFRTMGLRHLVVVDGDAVRGMITRQDLLVDALRRRLAELQQRLACAEDGGDGRSDNEDARARRAASSSPPRRHVRHAHSDTHTHTYTHTHTATRTTAAVAAAAAAAVCTQRK